MEAPFPTMKYCCSLYHYLS